MAQRRRNLTPAERAELWRRWKEGQSLSDIGRALGKHAATVYAIVVAHGGIPPSPRERAPRVLSFAEREEISRGVSTGLSCRTIADALGRAPSTVAREIGRNGGRGCYRASAADANAWRQARRPKLTKLAGNVALQQLVAEKLALDWSPEQISGWLRRELADQPHMHVSHETIYKSLFIQARGVLKKELRDHLRSGRRARRSSRATTAGQQRGRIIGGVSIRERPPEAEDRALPGHWEGDLLAGTNTSHIATLVERHSRFTMLVKVDGKDTANVVAAVDLQRDGTTPLQKDSPTAPIGVTCSTCPSSRSSVQPAARA